MKLGRAENNRWRTLLDGIPSTQTIALGAASNPRAAETPRNMHRACGAALALAAVGAALGIPAAALGAAGLPVVIHLRARRVVRRRGESFEHDFAPFLISFASALRAGCDPIAAMASTGNLFPVGSAIRVEIERFQAVLEDGGVEEAALAQFGAPIGSPDIELFRSAFLLSRQEGSSLGECLHRLARVIRQRQSFRRKIRSAIAMQKLSAVGIAGCAVVIGIFQVVGNPAGVAAALAHPVGRAALCGGSGVMLLGIVWMMRIVQTRMG